MGYYGGSCVYREVPHEQPGPSPQHRQRQQGDQRCQPPLRLVVAAGCQRWQQLHGCVGDLEPVPSLMSSLSWWLQGHPESVPDLLAGLASATDALLNALKQNLTKQGRRGRNIVLH